MHRPLINEYFITNKNARPGTKLKEVRAIVVHWTANTGKGANAKANANYFNSGVKASAQFIVDSTGIYQTMPFDEVTYHVGARKYRPIGNSLRIGKLSPNHTTVGIEMCVNSDGDFALTEKYTVELINYLLQVYNLDVKNVIRHYDVTGKNCPAMYLSEDSWAVFKSKLKRSHEEEYVTTASSLNVRAGIGTGNKIVGKLPKGSTVFPISMKDGWAQLYNGWVSVKYLSKK